MALVKDVKCEEVLTYGDWVERYHKLANVQGLTGEKILYARVRNLMKLRAFVTANSAAKRIPESQAFMDFKRELNDLQKDYIVKDQRGNFVPDMENKVYVEAYQKLTKKYKKAIDERQLDEKVFTEFMQESVPESEVIPVYSVLEPDNTEPMTQDQFDATWWFINYFNHMRQDIIHEKQPKPTAK